MSSLLIISCKSGEQILNFCDGIFKLDWQEIFLLQSNSASPIQHILQKHSNIFQEGLGTLAGFKAKIIVDPSAIPKYCKLRSVPYFFARQTRERIKLFSG